MPFNIYLILILFECVGGQQHVWTDQHVLSALGNHGDRITDLEKLVQTLVSSQKNLQQEVVELKASNAELLLRIKNITDNCLNFMKCSHTDHTTPTITTYNASLQSSTTTTSPSYIVHVTGNSHMTLTTTVTAKTTVAGASNTTTTTLSPTSTLSTSTTTLSSTSTLSPSTTIQNSFDTCHEAISNTRKQNGTFNIRIGPAGTVASVFCELVNGDSWLVIQRRQDGAVNFNRNWQEYKDGFGDLNGDFWLGNEIIHQITSSMVYTLRIDMGDWGGNYKYAEYEHFDVGSEGSLYKLSVGSYKGTAGDSFHYHDSQMLRHNSMPFSTPDRDHDHSFMNCAEKLKSGWWFNSCYSSNLNGKFLPYPYGSRMLGESFGDPTLEGTGIEWYPYRHRQYSMKKVEMKIKLANSGMRPIGRK
ncbi:fibrinogen-like protein 1 [Mercenaria mercenaria]|uniref:fibrinogen-like protein 1 n=1 Tax=Mercenaria mercenaria TaxID=6596 RepID=UPI00234E70D9|nr:fibrinogen-like protein 1 [Mercenaria mercenaria]